MIDEESTFEEFGYYSYDLKPKSHKRIVVQCETCGKKRTMQKCNYTHSISYKKDGFSLCVSCAMSKYRPRNYGESNNFYGKHHTTKTKNILREINKGKKGFWEGKHLSEDTRKKISDNHADFSKENHPNWKGRETITCESCGNEFDVPLWRADDSRFCTMACKILYCVAEKSSMWRGGISFGEYCPKFNRIIKQEIRDKYDNCDFMSGLPDTVCNSGKRLCVHHVDYNKSQGCDGHEWKLIPLSNSNHGRTGRFRHFWNRLFTYAIQYDEVYYDECRS